MATSNAVGTAEYSYKFGDQYFRIFFIHFFTVYKMNVYCSDRVDLSFSYLKLLIGFKFKF
jgi:hypothetical protein